MFAEHIATICISTLIQLHGDEPPEYLGTIGQPAGHARRFASGRATSTRSSSTLPVAASCRQGPDLCCSIRSFSGNTAEPEKAADWSAARQYVAQSGLPPLVLAGGLTPGNVAEAIAAVRPAAVDVASGVESARSEGSGVSRSIRSSGQWGVWEYPRNELPWRSLMNQELSTSKAGNLIAATIVGASLLISAIVVSRSLDNVADSIRHHAVPSFGVGRLRFQEPLTVHVDNDGQVPLKVETRQAK